MPRPVRRKGARSRTAAAGAARARPTPPRRVPAPAVPVFVPPEASAHAICRICGRIVRVSVPPDEIALLHSFSDRRPDGWTVEGMSFSFTGICPRCREQLRPE